MTLKVIPLEVCFRLPEWSGGDFAGGCFVIELEP